MKFKNILLLILLTLSTCPVFSAYADTRYVTDILILTVRSRADDEAPVLGHLKTADTVEVLEERDRYLKIRAKQGLEGWVQKNYITSKKPKAIIIEEMQNEINRLNSKIDDFDKMRDAYMDKVKESRQADKLKIQRLEENVSTLTGELKELNEKYNTLVNESKKNIGNLAGERQKLKAINTELNKEIDELKKNKDSSPVNKRIRFFLTGAGVLLLGFFLGRSAKRKKSYF